jgi:hypothetical protein
MPNFLTGIECGTGQGYNCPSLALGRNYRQLPTSGRSREPPAVPKSSAKRIQRCGTGFGRSECFLESPVIVSEVTWVDWRREAVSQVPWSDKVREVCFSGQNHTSSVPVRQAHGRLCGTDRDPADSSSALRIGRSKEANFSLSRGFIAQAQRAPAATPGSSPVFHSLGPTDAS